MKTHRTFTTLTVFLIGMLFSCLSQAQHLGVGVGSITLSTVGIQDKLVGEEVCFTLSARDIHGNLIRSWDQIGTPSTIILRNSTANTDSNRGSWSADPEAFSLASISHNGTNLLQVSDSEWTLPQTDFVGGMAEICLKDTKAEKGLFLELVMNHSTPRAFSDTMNFRESDITNYLIHITVATSEGNQVFVQRPYEMLVVPRDKYLNPCTTEIRTRFSARYPGDFSGSQAGGSDMFSGDFFLSGPTSFMLVSRSTITAPSAQWIMAYGVENSAIQGVSVLFGVLDHAPLPFKLVLPADNKVIELVRASQLETFMWETPTPLDPYYNIRRSILDQVTYSDEVRYTWVLEDALNRSRSIRMQTDNDGMNSSISLSHGQLYSLIQSFSGSSATQAYDFYWYVEATDNLYITRSTPQIGNKLRLMYHVDDVESTVSPVSASLNQNYPNPFNPSTSISFTTALPGKVKLVVQDIFGKELAVLVNGYLDPGEHQAVFDASGLPSGQYVYTLTAEGKRMARMMTVVK